MADQASVKFAHAYRAMRKAADAHPEYFDLARDVLRRHDDGSVTLLHALMQGLQAAYEAGRAGKPLPPLQLVQSSAELQSIARGDTPKRNLNAELHEGLDAMAKMRQVPKRPARAPGHSGHALAAQETTTSKRVVRRAR